jgi:ketosteroid isomerase-like protein
MRTAAESLDRYLSFFTRGTDIAGADPDGDGMKELLDCYSTNVRYEDVPSGKHWEGRDGVKETFVTGFAFGDEAKTILSRQTDGRQFSFELEVTGSNRTPIGAPGRSWVIRSASVGSFDDDGRVIEQRDYWDMKGWLTQVGVEVPLDPRALDQHLRPPT